MTAVTVVQITSSLLLPWVYGAFAIAGIAIFPDHVAETNLGCRKGNSHDNNRQHELRSRAGACSEMAVGNHHFFTKNSDTDPSVSSQIITARTRPIGYSSI